MKTTKFPILIIDYSSEVPLYRATCINGFGNGVGQSKEEALEKCLSAMAGVLEVFNRVNITFDLMSKEEYMTQTNSLFVGLKSWQDSTCTWVELEHYEIMKKAKTQ